MHKSTPAKVVISTDISYQISLDLCTKEKAAFWTTKGNHLPKTTLIQYHTFDIDYPVS